MAGGEDNHHSHCKLQCLVTECPHSQPMANGAKEMQLAHLVKHDLRCACVRVCMCTVCDWVSYLIHYITP